MKYLLKSTSPIFDSKIISEESPDTFDVLNYNDIISNIRTFICALFAKAEFDNTRSYHMDKICSIMKDYATDYVHKHADSLIVTKQELNDKNQIAREKSFNLADYILETLELIFRSDGIYAIVGEIIEAKIKVFLKENQRNCELAPGKKDADLRELEGKTSHTANSYKQTVICSIVCKAGYYYNSCELDFDESFRDEESNFNFSAVIDMIISSIIGNDAFALNNFITEFAGLDNYVIPDSGSINAFSLGETMQENMKNNIHKLYDEAHIYIAIVNPSIRIFEYKGSMIADYFIDVVDQSYKDDVYHCNLSSLLDEILCNFVMHSTWHLALKDIDGLIFEDLNGASYDIDEDYITWEYNGTLCDPILWFGPDNEPPRELWSIDEFTDDLEFWFMKDYDPLNKIVDDGAILAWYINELALFAPDMEEIRQACPIQLEQSDEIEDVISKLNQELIRRMEKSKEV